MEKTIHHVPKPKEFDNLSHKCIVHLTVWVTQNQYGYVSESKSVVELWGMFGNEFSTLNQMTAAIIYITYLFNLKEV